MSQRRTDAELSDADQFVLLFLLPVVAGAALPIVAASTDDAATWMVEHQILVDHDVLVEFPGTGGVGLDVARTALFAAVVIALLALAVIARAKRDDD